MSEYASPDFKGAVGQGITNNVKIVSLTLPLPAIAGAPSPSVLVFWGFTEAYAHKHPISVAVFFCSASQVLAPICAPLPWRDACVISETQGFL